MRCHRQSLFTAFTRIELIVAIGVIGLMLLAILPALREPRRRVKAINCVNLQKQIGLSFRLWSLDNGDKMPAQVSTNNGGTKELVSSGLVHPHFSVISNELGTPQILRCFSDLARTAATNFTLLHDSNISYFVVPEVDETIPELWLAGDRNLATNNSALNPGLFTMPTNQLMGWTSQLHSNKGNICLADGSVQQYTSAKLQQSATNAIRAYYEATTNATFRLVIP